MQLDCLSLSYLLKDNSDPLEVHIFVRISSNNMVLTKLISVTALSDAIRKGHISSEQVSERFSLNKLLRRFMQN